MLDKIKAEAASLGFSLSGFTSPESPESFPIYTNWIASKKYAGMAYLAQDRHVLPRQNPDLLMPAVKSILSLAYPYPNPILKSNTGKANMRGRVASYAWMPDYHITLPPLLEALARSIQDMVDASVGWMGFTDSAAILERDLAVRAGLGWIGRNSCLIHPEHGSFFLLAELFLDVTPDKLFGAADRFPIRISDHCGSCRKCVEACPTNCIQEDRTLDAGRCISYLTIEHKGNFSAEEKKKLGGWIFGCDICQMVCPWNQKFASQDLQMDVNLEVAFPDLHGQLELSAEEFKQVYAGMPQHRTKHAGWTRNCLAVLENNNEPS